MNLDNRLRFGRTERTANGVKKTGSDLGEQKTERTGGTGRTLTTERRVGRE